LKLASQDFWKRLQSLNIERLPDHSIIFFILTEHSVKEGTNNALFTADMKNKSSTVLYTKMKDLIMEIKIDEAEFAMPKIGDNKSMLETI
jgi:hypothetical protein